MRQDARHRSSNRKRPRARPAARHADETRAFTDADRPTTLGRIGPPTLPPSPDIDWHERGIEQEIAGDFHGAIESYANALRARGSDAQVVFDLAHALAEIGELERAAERYRQVTELDPIRADAWNNLGDLLAGSNDVNGAISAFRQAIILAPWDVDVRANLAATLRRDIRS